MTIKRLPVGSVLFRRARIGLLASGITSLVVLAGIAPASAAGPLSATGDGMTLTVVSVQLVNKVAVNVNFAVTCSEANFGTEPPGDGNFVIDGFTLEENVKGTIVSNEVSNSSGDFAPVTCNGTTQSFAIQFVPSGGPGYKAGPAFASNGQAGVFDTDASCGRLVQFGNFPNPCDNVSFSGAVQITG